MSNAKDCEQYCSDNNCCVCRNREWYILYEDYKKLKQENEELKERIDDLDQELYMAIDEGRAWIEKYVNALKEIKEIANHCINQDLCTFCNYNDKCYKGFEDEALSYDVCKIILEKCEVIDD